MHITILCSALLLALGAHAATVGCFGYTQSNQRYTTETTLTPANVGRLVQKWSYPVKGAVMASAITAVVGGREIVYVPTFGGELHAIVRTTGQRLWMRTLSTYTGRAFSNARATAAYFNGILVLGEQAGCTLFAVNATNGNKIWSTTLDPFVYCIFTQSPTINYNGGVLVGTASYEEYQAGQIPNYPCCKFQGAFFKLNVYTGAVLFKTRMIPDNAGRSDQYAGSGIWGSAPAIDYPRNKVYIATGNNYQAPQSVKNCINAASPANKLSCIATNDYVDAIVSVDMSSGAVAWARRAIGPDVWNMKCFGSCVGNGYATDSDFMQGALLTTISFNGRNYDVAIAVQKSGDVWCMTRDSGTLIWHVNVNPNSLSFGSAIDSKNVYIAVSDGGQNRKMHNGQTCNTGHWVALNKNNGAFVWEKCNPRTQNVGAPVTVTASGLLFVSSWDGYMMALSTVNGATLWSGFVGANLKSSGPTVSSGMVISGHGYRDTGSTTYIKAFGL